MNGRIVLGSESLTEESFLFHVMSQLGPLGVGELE